MMAAVLAIALSSRASGNLDSGEKMSSIYDFTLKDIDRKEVNLGQYRGKVIGGKRRRQMRLHTSVRRTTEGLYEVQGSRICDSRFSGKQLHGPGTGHRRRDQNLLFHKVQRHLPDLLEDICEG